MPSGQENTNNTQYKSKEEALGYIQEEREVGFVLCHVYEQALINAPLRCCRLCLRAIY